LVLGRSALADVDRKYQEDPEVVQAAVRFDGMQLAYAHGRALKDRSIVLAAIAKNGFALKFAPKGYSAEREVVLTAVKSNSFSFTLADDSLQKDCEFAVEAVHLNPFVRDYLDRSILSDERFVSALAPTKPKCSLAPALQAPASKVNANMSAPLVAEKRDLALAFAANTNMSAPQAAGKHSKSCRLICCLLPRLACCCVQPCRVPAAKAIGQGSSPGSAPS